MSTEPQNPASPKLIRAHEILGALKACDFPRAYIKEVGRSVYVKTGYGRDEIDATEPLVTYQTQMSRVAEVKKFLKS
jgi:hypothetical protein